MVVDIKLEFYYDVKKNRQPERRNQTKEEALENERQAKEISNYKKVEIEFQEYGGC